MKFDNVLQAVGKTPLIRLNGILSADGVARIYVKAEFMNPGGSIKDRAALTMLQSAIERGEVNGDTVVIEPTSGNTGIGLAMACAVKKLKLILTMPENMSVERRKILSAYGAEIVLTNKDEGMSGAIAKAKELALRNENSFIPSQFDNDDNARAHFLTTAPEIFADLPSTEAIVAGIGSGGTATGIADYIKANKLGAKVYGIEPSNSAVINGGKAGPHGLQGIGAGFIPKVLDLSEIAEVLTATEEEAYYYARRLAKEEGIMVGISAGAALAGAIKVSAKVKGDIVVILPDTGMRYVSTDLFE